MDVFYDVVSGGNINLFVKDVKERVGLGFKLQGGVAVSEGYYYQAMVIDFDKYEKITYEKKIIETVKNA